MIVFIFALLIIWYWFFQRIHSVQKSKPSPVKGIVLKKIEQVEKKDENMYSSTVTEEKTDENIYSNTVTEEYMDISNSGNVSVQV